MNPEDVVLPEDVEALACLYILINDRLNNIWYEYSFYVETCRRVNFKTSLVFPIIFSEMDFYEKVLQRIRNRIPCHILEEIEDDYYFSNW